MKYFALAPRFTLALPFALALPLALAACGTLPQPFYGNPGPVAARLAIPPAPVLMVPPPSTALLAGAARAQFAHDVATQLVNDDVPSVAAAPAKGEWQLGISARLNGNMVVPAYVVTGPDGQNYGRYSGAPAPAAGWAQGDAATLNAAAAADAPALTALLAGINAKIQQANPESLENRAPRVFLGAVTGAPGDGDVALPLNMSRDLPSPDLELVHDAAQADFTVTGSIKTQPDSGGQILVELDWVVRDSNGRITGQVTQMHDLSPADIEPYWGDVAAAAGQEAATGLQEVVAKAVLKRK